MLRTVLLGKIHRATVTGACLEYVGSISIDRELLDGANILPYEQVHVVNLNNGARLVTYALEATAGSGAVVLNGAAARLAAPGDVVIILSYGQGTELELRDHTPRVVYVDERNRVIPAREGPNTLVDLCASVLLVGNSLAALWLFAYGMNAYWLTLRRLGPMEPGKPGQSALPATCAGSPLPLVTVQLPVFNELYVCRRLLSAVAELDYPREVLHIQVLDDSTDETSALLRIAVEEYRERGFTVDYLHRVQRTGYKAGALERGTETARGELIAIFDADFLPPPDWLKQTVGYFQDPRVGVVQTRWGHTNPDYSLLTRLQALGIDGHFAVEQQARSANRYLLNFNGTAGVWRRTAIESSGGWQADTLAEDMDLSYRAQLAGWRAVYDNSVEAPAELPVSIAAYKLQQFRWAKGSIQCARKLLLRVLGAPLTPMQKLQATLHLTGYAVHPLMLLILLASLPLLLVDWVGNHPLSLVWGTLMVPATFGPPLLYLTAQRALAPAKWTRTIGPVALLAVLGAGLSLSNSRAVFSGLLGGGAHFRRTPKFDVRSQGDRWEHKRYRPPLDPTAWVELGLAGYAGGAIVLATGAGAWGVIPYLCLYLLGFAYVGGLSLYQHRRSIQPTAVSSQPVSPHPSEGL